MTHDRRPNQSTEKFADKFKLLKFGCCEAVHNLMPVLQRLRSLRKVSVTPWCDLRRLTETCRQNVIWCRKPIPLKVAIQAPSIAG